MGLEVSPRGYCAFLSSECSPNMNNLHRHIAVALFLIACGCTDRNPKAVETPPPVVMVATPIEREVTDYQIFTARTQAVESVEVKPRVTGYLMAIKFKDGDLINKDDILFLIDDRPYKATLEQAKATLEFSKAALVKAQADYDIGLAVQKNEKGAISAQEITRRLGARDEAKASVDQSLAALTNAQLNFDWCTVQAPISGRVDRHFVDVGNLVTQNMTTLTNIVSLRPMWAYFDVDQNSMLRFNKLVAEGKLPSAREKPVQVQMGLANTQDFPFSGETDFIANQVDPNTGSIRVRAVFKNTNLELASGLFGRVKVPTSLPHVALLVADEAIGTDQTNRYILVVNDKNEVEARVVQVGQLHGQLREVMRTRTVIDTAPDGADVKREVEVLKAGERIVVQGLQRARPGAKVDPKLVDMLTMMPVADGKSPPAKKK